MSNHTHPVVGFTIVDRSIDLQTGRVLVVVRDPTTNLTHPDVVSVPTLRVPRGLFDALFEHSDVIGRFRTSNVHESFEASSRIENGHDAAIFVTRTVLASKLGMADALESGIVSFQAKLRTSATGHVYYPNLASETIYMANLLVILSEGADLVQERTASCSQILWVPVNSFLEAVRRKDPSLFGLDPFEFCIHGLCIATSYDMLAFEFGLDAHDSLGKAEIPQEDRQS